MIDGPTSLAVFDDQVMRFRAHGWAAERIDGHETDALVLPPRGLRKGFDRSNELL